MSDIHDLHQPDAGVNRPEKKTRRKKSRMGVIAQDITKEELAKWFHLPSEEACTKLGISLTVLKRVCRKYGISRWPFRKVKSLERLLSHVTSALPATPFPAASLAAGSSLSLSQGPSSADTSPSAARAAEHETPGTRQPSPFLLASALALASRPEASYGSPRHAPSPRQLMQQQQRQQQGPQHQEAQREQQQQLGLPQPHHAPAAAQVPSRLASDANSLSTSAIEILISALESGVSQPGPASQGPPPGAGHSLGSDSGLTLQGLAEAMALQQQQQQAEQPQRAQQRPQRPLAERQDSLEEGEIPSPGMTRGGSGEGCGECEAESLPPAAAAAAAATCQLAATPAAAQGAPPAPGPATPGAAAAAAADPPRPAKPMSLKHMVLAKWAQHVQLGGQRVQRAQQQGAALTDESSGCFAASRKAPAPAAAPPLPPPPHCAPTDGKPPNPGPQRLQQEGSCELERLPTFEWAPKAPERAATVPSTPPAAGSGPASSPTFSFSAGALVARQVHLWARGEREQDDTCSSGGRRQRAAAQQQARPAFSDPAPVMMLARHDSTSLLPHLRQQRAVAAGVRPMHAGVRPPGATGPRTSRKRRASAPPGAGAAPLLSPFKQPRLGLPGERPSRRTGEPEEVSSHGQLSQPLPAQLPGAIQQLLLHRQQLLAMEQQPPSLTTAASSQDAEPAPAAGVADAAAHAAALQEQQRLAQQAQQASAAALQAILAQEAHRAQMRRQLSGSGSLSASLGGNGRGSGGGLEQGGPGSFTLELSGSTEEAGSGPFEAAKRVQREQLRDAIRAAVASGRGVPPRLALYCLQKYAQRLGFSLHGAQLLRLEGPAASEAAEAAALAAPPPGWVPEDPTSLAHSQLPGTPQQQA